MTLLGRALQKVFSVFMFKKYQILTFFFYKMKAAEKYVGDETFFQITQNDFI